MGIIIILSVIIIALIGPSEAGCMLASENPSLCEFEAECYDSTSTIIDELNKQSCTEKRTRTSDYDYYNYGRRPVYITTRSYENVILHLKMNSRSTDSDNGLYNLRQLKDHVKSLVMKMDIATSIPSMVYDMSELTDFEITGTMIKIINLNSFLENRNLKKINASENLISILQESGQSAMQSIVKTIDLSHNLIERIPNNYFIRFSQLQYLDLSYNSLSSIDILAFEGISELQSLRLSYNKLLQIGQNFIRFVNLKELYLDNNRLSLIDETNFGTMTKLEKLNLSSNIIVQITDGALKNLISLVDLDLGNNKIAIISKSLLKHNINLQTIVLSNNNIESIESGAFEYQNITNFHIENNCLTGVLQTKTFKGIQINSLNLSKSKITALSPEAFGESQIHSLNLSSNLISNISETSFNFIKDLHELDISNNILTNIDFNTSDLSELLIYNAQNNNIKRISRTTLKNLKSLTQLDLSHNNISEIEALSFEDLRNLEIIKLIYNPLPISVTPHFFSGLTSVTNIELAYTGVTSFENEAFSGLELLNTLNASHCKLVNIDNNAFDNTGAIKVIDLSYNLLEDLRLNATSLSLLKILYLNNNKLLNVTHNTFCGLSNLEELNLSHNKIVEVAPEAFRFLNNIHKFDLSFNTKANFSASILENMTVLTEVSFSNIHKGFNFERISNVSMKQLDLSMCHIENLTIMFVYKVKDIEKLNLSSNRINFIDKSSFKEMPELKWLDLSNNFIRNIQPGSFLHTNKITVLNLNHNELRSLQFGFLDGLQLLQTLNLSHNSIHDFSMELLHTTPLISTLSLDDNLIEDIKFEDFTKTHLKILSIGGNLIPCHIFVELKNNELSLNITAEILDYHDENVNGIKCTSGVRLNNTLVRTNINSADINSNIPFIEMMNSIDNLRSTIDKIYKENTSPETDIKRDMLSILESLNKHNDIVGNSSHEVQSFVKDKVIVSIRDLIRLNNETNQYLKNQTEVQKDTNTNLLRLDQYLKNQTEIQKQQRTSLKYSNDNQINRDNSLQENIKILNEEKEKIVAEIKSMFEIAKNTKTDLKEYNAQPIVLKENNDTQVMLIIIAVCLSVIALICVYNLLDRSLKSRKLVRQSSSYSGTWPSTRPIANDIEME